MSASIQFLLSARIVFCAVLLFVISACSGGMTSRSPWRAGVGIKIAPTVAIRDAAAGPTLHPTFVVSRLEGGTTVVEGGAQIRWPLTVGDRGIWAGFEALVGRDGVTGVTGSGIVGVPILGDNSWKPSFFASAGLSRYGGGTGKSLSIGVDIQPRIFDLR